MASDTSTDWDVIRHPTFSINAACIRAWIDTFVTNTALIPRAIGVQYTRRTARAVWIANVVCGTDT